MYQFAPGYLGGDVQYSGQCSAQFWAILSPIWTIFITIESRHKHVYRDRREGDRRGDGHQVWCENIHQNFETVIIQRF